LRADFLLFRRQHNHSKWHLKCTRKSPKGEWKSPADKEATVRRKKISMMPKGNSKPLEN